MNEIGDDFYATIKLRSGEEIFAKVAPCEEEDRTMLILSNPIIVEELVVRGKFQGFKMEPWIKTSSDDMFILNMDEVMTMSESDSIEMIVYYQDYVRKIIQEETSLNEILAEGLEVARSKTVGRKEFTE